MAIGMGRVPTSAMLPAAGIVDRLMLVLDTQTLWRDTGAAWQQMTETPLPDGLVMLWPKALGAPPRGWVQHRTGQTPSPAAFADFLLIRKE